MVAGGFGGDIALAVYPVLLVVTASGYVGYLLWRNPVGFRDEVGAALAKRAVGTDLLRFSAPLLLSSLLLRVMTWTDVLMLSYFTTPTIVGFYDAVRPLVRIITIIWAGMIYMYTPVASSFHAGYVFSGKAESKS